jgi:hypothetical protein
MTRIGQRCRQCGSTHETDEAWIPPYGLRVRCVECGSLLPLLECSGIEREALAPPAAPAAGAPDDRSALEAALLSRPSRAETREVLRRWLLDVARGEPRPLTAELVFREHGAELARMIALWQGSYPGREATELFREELMTLIACMTAAAQAAGAARGAIGAPSAPAGGP